MSRRKKQRGGPASVTPFGRECDRRKIPPWMIAEIGLSSVSTAISWRQGLRKPSLAKAFVLSAGLLKRCHWRISSTRLIASMQRDSVPADVPVEPVAV